MGRSIGEVATVQPMAHQTAGDGRDSCGRSGAAPVVLFQRRYGENRLMALSPVPVIKKFFLIDAGPFHHQTNSSRGQPACEDGQVVDIDQCFVLAVIGVKMRRAVVVKKHLDHDTEKSANFRHQRARVSGSGKHLLGACR